MDVGKLLTTASVVLLVAALAATWAGAARPASSPGLEHARPWRDVVRGEAAAPGGHGEQRWRAHLALVTRALEANDVSAAVRAWHDAYGAAMGERQWLPMVEVGDAFVRIGATAHTASGAKPNARQAYLIALGRARRDGSVEGVQRVARAFEALGDHEVAQMSQSIADRLARNH